MQAGGMQADDMKAGDMQASMCADGAARGAFFMQAAFVRSSGNRRSRSD
jgi:hypothetical protein